MKTLKLISNHGIKAAMIENPLPNSTPRINSACLMCIFRGHPDCDALLEQIIPLNPEEFTGACEDLNFMQYFSVEDEV